MSGAVADPEAAPRPAKQDPEALVLRARPRPVVRFRRGVIILAAAAGSASLIAVAWFALDPPAFRLAAGTDEAGEAGGRGAPDILAEAPSTYSDVPKLGPPLPGDLGRPILEHERRREEDLGGGADPRSGALARARSAAEDRRARQEAAAEAARASGVLVQLGRTSAPAGLPIGSDVAPASGPDVASTEGGAASSDTGHQRHKLEFAQSGPGEVSPHRLRPAPSPWTLSAGSIIPASLVTGLNSDLPGIAIAQVTQNVLDSATGRFVLVPQGSRLIGRYDSLVAFGQRRALLVWQRILFPDGSSVSLDNMPATDLSGYAGLEDEVDFHSWQLLKGVALSTLLGVGTELGLGSGESDLVRAVREATQQNAARAGDRIVSRNLDVQPTITVRPGWPLRAVLHQDLILKPWGS